MSEKILDDAYEIIAATIFEFGKHGVLVSLIDSRTHFSVRT